MKSKMCPFKKRYSVLYWHYDSYGTSSPEMTEEEFLPCEGESCAAYYNYEARPYWDAQYTKTYKGCKLMKQKE